MALFAVAFTGCNKLAGTTTTTEPEPVVTEPETPAMEFKAGWYKYTTTAGGTSSSLYIEYDANKNITRAGGDYLKYDDSVFETFKNNSAMQWDYLSKSVDDNHTFETIIAKQQDNWVNDFYDIRYVNELTLKVGEEIRLVYYNDNYHFGTENNKSDILANYTYQAGDVISVNWGNRITAIETGSAKVYSYNQDNIRTGSYQLEITVVD